MKSHVKQHKYLSKMKELTTNDKASLVSLLERYYTIEEKNFIDAIASNEEERLNLTLKAYAMEPKYINTPTNVSTALVPKDMQIVVIDNLYSKLQFVKAIKEVKNIGLKEAKDFADHILIKCEEQYGQFYSKPFMIGDHTDSIFTSDQWAKICECLGNSMHWHWKYV